MKCEHRRTETSRLFPRRDKFLLTATRHQNVVSVAPPPGITRA